MSWIENQTGAFKNLSILDVGAASGVFSIPFAKGLKLRVSNHQLYYMRC